jgi:hypothetical protein
MYILLAPGKVYHPIRIDQTFGVHQKNNLFFSAGDVLLRSKSDLAYKRNSLALLKNESDPSL